MTYSVRQFGANTPNLIWLKCPLRILATAIIFLSFINQNTIFVQAIHVLVSRLKDKALLIKRKDFCLCPDSALSNCLFIKMILVIISYCNFSL